METAHRAVRPTGLTGELTGTGSTERSSIADALLVLALGEGGADDLSRFAGDVEEDVAACARMASQSISGGSVAGGSAARLGGLDVAMDHPMGMGVLQCRSAPPAAANSRMAPRNDPSVETS